MKIGLIILGLTIFSGCSYEQYLNIELDLHDQPAWLWDGSAEASDFWLNHGVNFSVGGQGGLPVVAEELPGSILGETSWDKIRIDPVANNEKIFTHQRMVCIIAHEFGHDVGMEHDSGRDSLMFPKEHQQPDDTCSWSKEDQAELCRAHSTNSTCEH